MEGLVCNPDTILLTSALFPIPLPLRLGSLTMLVSYWDLILNSLNKIAHFRMVSWFHVALSQTKAQQAPRPLQHNKRRNKAGVRSREPSNLFRLPSSLFKQDNLKI